MSEYRYEQLMKDFELNARIGRECNDVMESTRAIYERRIKGLENEIVKLNELIADLESENRELKRKLR